MEILTLQIIFLFSIVLATFIPYAIPLVLFSKSSKLEKSYTVKILLSILDCISCGVFIGVCFLGLIPFSLEKMNDAFKILNIKTEFPFTESLVVMGFFLILFVEECAKSLKSYCAVNRYSEADVIISSDQHSLIGNNETPTVQNNHHRAHSHNIVHDNNDQRSSLAFFIITLASSLHSFFEGLAVGLQLDIDKACKIFTGMIIHESMMAFALGIGLSKIQMTCCQNFKYVLVFCFSIPCGMIFGIFIGQTPGVAAIIANSVLQSIAAGTFIHVTFMELLPSVFSDGKNGLFKVLFIFIGFILVTVISLAFD